MTLEGRVAIVTGAAQGIGREYAKGLAANGAAVIVADTNESGASETMTPINRRTEPDGLNGVLLFVLSEAASWMTGQTLIVDGGFLKRI